MSAMGRTTILLVITYCAYFGAKNKGLSGLWRRNIVCLFVLTASCIGPTRPNRPVI